LRYEYNKDTFDKEKLKDAILIDESLDVESLLSSDRPHGVGRVQCPYDLGAALDTSSLK